VTESQSSPVFDIVKDYVRVCIYCQRFAEVEGFLIIYVAYSIHLILLNFIL